MKEKIKVKVGMIELGNDGHHSRTMRKVLILEEYETDYLILYGNIVRQIGDFEISPTSTLVNKRRVFNIKEREISKFRLWLYKYWNNNF